MNCNQCKYNEWTVLYPKDCPKVKKCYNQHLRKASILKELEIRAGDDRTRELVAELKKIWWEE